MRLKYTTPNNVTITLESVRLSTFNTENLYEGEDFNRSGRKHTISGTAIITGNPLTASTGAIDVIRNSLNAPRGKIELEFSSQTGTWYTLAEGSNGSVAPDARNGPLPEVNVTRIEGTHSAAVTFVSFNYTFFNCSSTRIQRFSMQVSQTLDEAGFITMTRSGHLKLSSLDQTSPTPSIYTNSNPQQIPTLPAGAASINNGASPDLYRNLIAGKPGPFFRRVNQNYALNSSLNTLDFTVEDRMVFREHKFPVMMGDASFTYERGLDNMLGNKTFSAHFEGGPDTDPANILAVAVEAAQARIDFQKDILQSITVREPNIYGRNRVELTVIAKGQGGDRIDISVIRNMFTDPHIEGITKYCSAYGSGGVYLETVDGLRFDPCVAPDIVASVIEPNPDDSGQGQTTLSVRDVTDDADITDSEGTDDTTPLDDDNGIDDTDNFITHLTSTQRVMVEDTGMVYLEATGGQFQWPIQMALPRVIVFQEVRYVTISRSTPIPWPTVDDAYIVRNQDIVTNHAPPDAVGKPTFAVVAKREIVLQTSRGTNRLIRDDVVPRIVYSPESIAQARGLYTQNNRIAFTQTDTSGNETRQDAIGGSGFSDQTRA